MDIIIVGPELVCADPKSRYAGNKKKDRAIAEIHTTEDREEVN